MLQGMLTSQGVALRELREAHLFSAGIPADNQKNPTTRCWCQRQEQYLGNNNFKVELNMSCAEMYEEVKKVIDCTPIT